jgi:peptide/nickel transport system permease protein
MRLGLALAVAVVLVAVLGPLFATHPPDESIGTAFEAPSAAAPLGTDDIGRDVLSRVLWGGRTVVWMSLAATFLGVGVGVLVGLVAGYSRNFVDHLLMRPLEVVQGFPQIVLALLFVSLLGSHLPLIVGLVALAWVPSVARVTRGITLETVKKDFVEAAEVIALPRRRIVLSEILPNLTTPLMVEFGIRLTYSIIVIASINYLGFGVQPPTADWGLMINENRPGLVLVPWPVVAPICLIALFTIGVNLMAEGVARTMAGIDRKADQQ